MLYLAKLLLLRSGRTERINQGTQPNLFSGFALTLLITTYFTFKNGFRKRKDGKVVEYSISIMLKKYHKEEEQEKGEHEVEKSDKRKYYIIIRWLSEELEKNKLEWKTSQG